MTWLSAREAAQILHIGERAVRTAAQQNRYQSRYVKGKGQGGKQLRIALESLPEKAQARYRGEEPPHEDILQYTGKQREEADAKAWAVEQYHQSDLSPAEFVSWFNACNPPEDAISESKLFRWQKKYQEKDVAALIDRRGGHNRGKDTIFAEAWELFYSLYITHKEIVAQAPTLDEFIKLLSAYIAEYNQTANGGMDMDGKSPDQVYAENLAIKRVVSDLDTLHLLCGNSEERVVHKNGISIKNNNYYNDALLYHQGERVIVVYDPDNIDKIAVFDMENRAICMAEAKIRTSFRHTSEEDYIRAAKEKKKSRAMVQRYKPSRDVDIHEIIA